MERKLYVLAVPDHATMCFIKVELQSRRELCLEIRLEILFSDMETEISFSPALTSLSLQRQEMFYGH